MRLRIIIILIIIIITLRSLRGKVLRLLTRRETHRERQIQRSACLEEPGALSKRDCNSLCETRLSNDKARALREASY